MNLVIKKYLDIFEKYFPNENIKSKKYNITIIRNLMIYFLHKEYKEKKISRLDIQNFFELPHVNSIYLIKVNIIGYIYNINYLSNKKSIFHHFYYLFYKAFKNNPTEKERKMTPFEINPENNFLLELLKPDNFEHYDDLVKVYHTGNDHYLVRDSREGIQFRFKKDELDILILDKNEGFDDEIFFKKIAAQNELDGDFIDKNDSFYVTCLLSELERLIDHCKYSYNKFN